MFAPNGWSPALFMPPMRWGMVLNTAVAWERVGSYAWPRFCGVLAVEAEKHLYAPIAGSAKEVKAKLRPANAVTPRLSTAARLRAARQALKARPLIPASSAGKRPVRQ